MAKKVNLSLAQIGERLKEEAQNKPPGILFRLLTDLLNNLGDALWVVHLR